MRLLVILAVLLTACGADRGADQTTPASPAVPTQDTPEEGDTITGRLGGDAQLEGGCAWVDDGRTRWEVHYPPGYEITFDPVTLTGPEGQTAAEGDEITVTGAEDSDVMTICQVGPVWRATSVEFGG